MNEEEYLTRYEDNINTLNAIVNKIKTLDKHIIIAKIGIILGIIGIPIIALAIAIFTKISFNDIEGSLIFICSIIVIVAGSCTGFFYYTKYRIKHYTEQFNITDSNTYDISVAYLMTTLDISAEKFNFTLNDILKEHIELADCWWYNTDRVNVIKDELYKVLHIDKNNLEKSDLIVRKIQLQNEGLSIDNEHMKLQNESLSIDNEQKKFWTCQYCGNMNRGEDMSCIKCGANRT